MSDSVVIYGRDISTNQIIAVPVGGLGQNRFIYTSAGAVGPTGAQGIQGEVGATGPQGLQGEVGATGPQGIQGEVGATGSQGEIGATGPQGIQGEVGATGPQGLVGATGPQGLVGATGPQGIVGATGPQGIQGEKGDTGAQGIQGEVGATGPQGIQGEVGATGPQGLQGEVGATGPQGIQGEVGATGPQGIQGEVGATGPQGLQGEVGATGPQGLQGEVGATGPQGLQGEVGATGPQGLQGEVGATGPQGLQGEVGATGPQGLQGEVGATGPQGIQGEVGATGPQGLQGEVGATGPQGLQGEVGATGPQGIQGEVGATGPQGIQGEVGATGPQGIQGEVGATGPAGPNIDLDQLLDVSVNSLTTDDIIVYDGSYWRNQNKNNLMITSGAVYCNAGKKDINDALAEVGAGGVIMLSTGTHSPAAAVFIASKDNIGIECVAGILPPSSICEITQQVALLSSSSRVRISGVQLDGGLQIGVSGSGVNHNFYSCYMDSLNIQAGTPTSGSRFLRFTDCEINNTYIDQFVGTIYFIRCSFTGSFANQNTTLGRVVMVDCIIPNPVGNIVYGGTSSTGLGLGSITNQHLGASSLASLSTNYISSGTLKDDLVFTGEDTVSKIVLTDYSTLDALYDVSYVSTLANGEVLYVDDGEWINKKLTYSDISGSLSFADITGQLDTATQLDNSGITIAGAFVALGESISLDLQDLTDISFSTTPVAGEYLRSDGTDFKNSALLTSDLCGNYQFIDFNTNPTVTQQEGRIHWDNTDGTLNIGLSNGTELHAGQETYYIVRNETASIIPKGTVVYSSGVYGGTGNSRISVSPAIANGSIQSIRYIGVANEAIGINSFGKVWNFGYIRTINTNTLQPSGETWVAGDLLFSSPTVAGGLTKVMPSAPNLIIPVAIVIVAGNNGTLFVRPTLTNSLAELLDVSLNAFADKQVLVNNGTEFVNRQMLYSDISGTVSDASQNSNKLVHFNATTNQLEKTLDITVNSVLTSNRDILIGQQSLQTASTGKQIIFNTTTTPINNSATLGGFYISPSSVRSVGGSERMIFNRSTGEVSSWTDTLNTLDDVNTSTSPADSTDGALLRYNTSTAVYDRRRTQYYNVCWYGQLASFASNVIKPIFDTATWASVTQDTEYYYPINKFSLTTSTGILSGCDTTKAYKIELHISQNSNNISTSMNWMAVIRANNGVGTILRTARIGVVSDDRCPSLHLIAIVSGYSAYYFGLGPTLGTYTTTVTPDAQICLAITEV